MTEGFALHVGESISRSTNFGRLTNIRRLRRNVASPKGVDAILREAEGKYDEENKENGGIESHELWLERDGKWEKGRGRRHRLIGVSASPADAYEGYGYVHPVLMPIVEDVGVYSRKMPETIAYIIFWLLDLSWPPRRLSSPSPLLAFFISI